MVERKEADCRRLRKHRSPRAPRTPPRRAWRFGAFAGIVAVASLSPPAQAQSLRGSAASLDRQNRMARQHDFTYLRTASQVARFVDGGYLVPVRPGRDYDLHNVSFPYARPEVALFVTRLAAQYRGACGERLVVTSLTRPLSSQPWNASDRSVHPTGMAVDFRLSNRRSCRSWLEGVLLSLERTGVLEATRERIVPHYHVAIYPKQYEAYVNRVVASQAAAAEASEYRVRRGDSLWEIARRSGTTVEHLKAENGLRTSRIYAGQLIQVPNGR